MEPTAFQTESQGLRLNCWDYGESGKRPLLLVHGSMDHARSWDWVASVLRNDYHVIAIDLRGHGDSDWAQGGGYTVAHHVLDLAALCARFNEQPLTLIGHSLGGVISLMYTGTYPENVARLVVIEGMGPPPSHHSQTETFPERVKRWVDQVREIERRSPRSYSNVDAAVLRMRESNPHLSEEMARHLTLHGLKRNADGSFVWKFDPYVRGWPPYGFDRTQGRELLQRIKCPVLLFRGMESWASDPEKDGRAQLLSDYRLVNVPNAGHWLHHDQLELFLAETREFLSLPAKSSAGSI